MTVTRWTEMPSRVNWPNNPNRPVEKVSWADAQIFLTRLNATAIGKSTCRLGLCFAHRVAMGICLPGGNDPCGVFLGGGAIVTRMRIVIKNIHRPECEALRRQSVGLF